MPIGSTASKDALFARADKAIAHAVSLRARVRSDLKVAGQRRVHRPHISDVRPPEVCLPGPMLPSSFLEPWWSVARALTDAGQIIREADRELDLAYHRVLPTIETPLSLFGG